MKTVVILFILSFFTGSGLLAQKKHPTDSVDVTIRLTTPAKAPVTDSILVIFDRYDHAGAGIIKKVFHPVNNQVLIIKVPPARYYIEISCLGTCRRKFNELTFVNNRRSNTFTYRIDKADTFVPGLVVIPVQPIDFSKLEIFKSFHP